MACVRHTAHVSNDKTHLEVTKTTSREVAEVLSTMSKDTLEAVVSRSHESSKADVEDSNDDSGSEASADKVSDSKSDATKKAKVVTAVGLTFDFGPSRVGKGPIRAMEGLRYFAKSEARAPSTESVSEPRIDEVVVFEDLFIVGLQMSSHPALVDIL
jgi:hypothetical protein